MTKEKRGTEYLSTKKRNAAKRITKLSAELKGMEARSEALWRELTSDVRRPDFDTAMRGIRELESRIETHRRRITSLRNNEPELGARVDYYTIATQYQRK